VNRAPRPPRRLFALVPAAVLIVALASVNVPYIALFPGPARDVGALIEVDGVATHPSEGRLFLTTVQLGPLTLGQAVRAWLDDTITVIDRDLIYPPDRTPDEVDDENLRQMQQSQAFAAAAALQHLGYRVNIVTSGARVITVASDVPAAAVLRPGDVIVRAGGKAIQRSEQLTSVVGDASVGAEIALTVKRSDEEIDVKVRTVERPGSDGESIIGIFIETVISDIELPLELRIDAGEIGGPSAGLMFALGVIDVLREEDITRGRVVAGTGEITPDGVVGAVGAVAQKVVAAQRAGAELFLVPDDELEQACGVTETITVIGVRTLADALGFLAAPETADRTCGPAPVVGATG